MRALDMKILADFPHACSGTGRCASDFALIVPLNVPLHRVKHRFGGRKRTTFVFVTYLHRHPPSWCDTRASSRRIRPRSDRFHALSRQHRGNWNTPRGTADFPARACRGSPPCEPRDLRSTGRCGFCSSWASAILLRAQPAKKSVSP